MELDRLAVAFPHLLMLSQADVEEVLVAALELSEIIAAASSEPRSIEPLLERYDRDQQARWRRLLGIGVEIRAREPLSARQAARLVSCLPASDRDLDALLAQLGLIFVSETGHAMARDQDASHPR